MAACAAKRARAPTSRERSVTRAATDASGATASDPTGTDRRGTWAGRPKMALLGGDEGGGGCPAVGDRDRSAGRRRRPVRPREEAPHADPPQRAERQRRQSAGHEHERVDPRRRRHEEDEEVESEDDAERPEAALLASEEQAEG